MRTKLAEPRDFATLYNQAFEQYGASALWSSQPVSDPTPADALAITQSLRVEGTSRRGVWRSRSSRPAVPLSKIQTDVLRLLASHRDPESYIAGSTPLNRNGQRYSGDVDIFHDRQELVARTAKREAALIWSDSAFAAYAPFSG